jgi:hypothetical protein
MQIVTKMPYLNRVFNSQDLHIVGIAETHLVNDSVISCFLVILPAMVL